MTVAKHMLIINHAIMLKEKEKEKNTPEGVFRYPYSKTPALVLLCESVRAKDVHLLERPP